MAVSFSGKKENLRKYPVSDHKSRVLVHTDKEVQYANPFYIECRH